MLKDQKDEGELSAAVRNSEEPCRDVQWAVDRNGTKTQYDSPPPGPGSFLAIYFGGCLKKSHFGLTVPTAAEGL